MTSTRIARGGLALSCLVASCTAPPKLHPNWEEGIAAAESIEVCPPEVVLLNPDAEGYEALQSLTPEEVLEIREELMTLAAEGLSGGGLAATVSDPDDPGARVLHEDYRLAIRPLLDPYDSYALDEEDEGARYRLSMGSSIRSITRPRDPDLVLCTQVIGMQRDMGDALMDDIAAGFADALTELATLGMSSTALGTDSLYDPRTEAYRDLLAIPPSESQLPFSRIVVRVSVVDRETGDVLWTDRRITNSWARSTARSHVRSLVRGFLRNREDEID